MAPTQQPTHSFPSGAPARDSGGCGGHHGQVILAEVVPIRPESAPQDFGAAGVRFKIAQVFASLRAQAAPGSTPPRSPTPPAPLTLRPQHSTAPDDAA